MYGTASTNNGLSPTVTGPFYGGEGASEVTSTTTVKRLLILAAGTGTTLVTMTSQAAYPQGETHVRLSCQHDLTASVVPPDPTVVEVASLLLRVAYTTPAAQGSPTITYLAFGPRDEGLAWLCSTGALDAAEWDPLKAVYVEGTARDGGAPMPEGWWESARMPGELRRLARVEAEREGVGPVSLLVSCERAPRGETAQMQRDQRWARFSPRLQGRTFRLRVRVAEDSGAIRAFDMVFDPLAGPDR